MTELAAVEKGMFPKPEGDCILVRSAGKEKKKEKKKKGKEKKGKKKKKAKRK